MMAPVAAELFITQAALHGSVLRIQDFQGLAKIRTCHVNTTKYSWYATRTLLMQSDAGCRVDMCLYLHHRDACTVIWICTFTHMQM